MKIKHSKIENVVIGDGADTTIKAGIREDDLGLAFTMVSKNLYSNPIGSFIREITANAVDANYEAGVRNPVIIDIYEEEGIHYISFKDQGTGMTPERFNEIYMNIFASDKRDSNLKIGGWGIGSKSPLAYQDMFELVTVVDGIEYSYVLDNSDTNLKADLISQVETDEPNGTTVIVEIKPEDLYTVNKQCHRQLSYFQEIYVKDNNYYFDNEYTIYDGGFFLLKDKERPFGDLHLSINGVPYPIDWNVLNIERYEVPVALKCTFDDLDVTLSRESINYTEEVKEYLRGRIQEAQDYFDSLYEDGLQTDNPFHFYRMIEQGNRFTTLNVGDVELSIKLTNAKPTFTPLDFKIRSKERSKYLFSCFNARRIQKGAFTFSFVSEVNELLYGDPVYYTEKDRAGKYDLLYVEYGVAIKKKITKKTVFEVAHALGYTEKIKGASEYGGIHSKYKLKEGYIGAVHQWNKAVLKAINESDRFRLLDGIADEEWIANYQEEQRQLKLERKEYITSYSIYNTMERNKYGDLIDEYKAIFMIDKKADKEMVLSYDKLISGLPNAKRFKLLIVNPTTLNKLKSKPKFYHAKDVFRIKSIRNHLCRLRLYKAFKENIYPSRNLFSKYSEYYRGMYDELYKLYNKPESTYKQSYWSIPLTKQSDVGDISVDLLRYFKKQLDNVYPNTLDKRLYKEELFLPLMIFAHQIKDAEYILPNAPHRVVQKFVATLKCRKLNEEYYKSSLINY